jgi:hypothetical protein
MLFQAGWTPATGRRRRCSAVGHRDHRRQPGTPARAAAAIGHGTAEAGAATGTDRLERIHMHPTLSTSPGKYNKKLL